MRSKLIAPTSFAAALALAACATSPSPPVVPVALAAHVDVPRFMGDWYVIANIPTMFEKGARDARDTYRLDTDGTILTTFSYHDANTDGGPFKTIDSRAFVMDRGRNAVWGQEYVWPFKADYRISYLSADYSQVVIARDKRDYVWIMARTPTISATDLDRLTAFVAGQGYDVSKLQRVPQSPLK